MLTPIRPSLSQALTRQGNAVQPVQSSAGDSRSAALEAQRAFFRQAMGQASSQATPASAPTPAPRPTAAPSLGLQTQSLRAQIDAATPQRAQPQAQRTPGVFKAADVQQARIQALQSGDIPAPLRPGSLLNIVV